MTCRFEIVEPTPVDRARKDWLVSMLMTYKWENLSIEELDEIATLAEIE